MRRPPHCAAHTRHATTAARRPAVPASRNACLRAPPASQYVMHYITAAAAATIAHIGSLGSHCSAHVHLPLRCDSHRLRAIAHSV